MKQIILFLTIFFSISLVSAKDDNFNKANTLYSEGKYNDAITSYHKLLEGNKHSASIYFNLGNSYYKNGNIAKAILNYERAKILSPSDKDILNNLAFVNSQISDRIEKKTQYFIAKWLNKFISTFHSNNWAYIAISMWILLFILLFIFVSSKKIRVKKGIFPIIIISFICSIFSFYASYQQYDDNKNNIYAIIMSSSVTTQSTPSFNGTDLFILHEGTKVKLTEKVGNWYKLQLTDGRDSWIPEKDIEKIQ